MSTENKHTPGPWCVAVPPSSCLTSRFVEGPAGEHIAKVGHMDYTSGSQESDHANARLMAAAPELLEACEKAMRETACTFNPSALGEELIATMCRTTLQHLHNQMKGAIAKAKGQ